MIKKKEADKTARLNILDQHVKGKTRPNLHRPGRILLREGSLIQLKKKGERKIYVFLFNDMILCSKQQQVRKNLKDHTLRYEHRLVIQLSTSCSAKDVSPKELNVSEVELYFKVIDTQAQVFLFKADSPMDKKMWINDIKNAIDSSFLRL